MAFVALLMIAALLAAYRMGYERGRMLGPVVPATFSVDRVYTREYEVADIVKSEADAALLIKAIQENVESDSWDVVGGYGEVTCASKSGTLTLSHVLSGHLSMIQYLGLVRENMAVGSVGLEVAVQDATHVWLSNQATRHK
ncbi:MAG: hypothetical protein KDB23_02890 [Planctomycetales bacterium]|nr:hypothetical protein [Planctomycetales bacterium]